MHICNKSSTFAAENQTFWHMKRIFLLFFCVAAALCSMAALPLCGKVKIIDSFEDVKVKIVDSFEDIKIKIVDCFEGVKKDKP